MATKVLLNQLGQSGATTTGQVVQWNNSTGFWEVGTLAAGISSSGVSGAIQFSDGSGGLNSDAANLFFNDSTNRLGVGITGGIIAARIHSVGEGITASTANIRADDSAGTVTFRVNDNGQVWAGKNFSILTNVQYASLATGNNNSGFGVVELTNGSAGSITNTVAGIITSPLLLGSNAFTNAKIVSITANNENTSTSNNIWGNFTTVTQTSTGARANKLIGQQIEVGTGSATGGTVSEIMGLRLRARVQDSAVTATSLFGMYIEDMTNSGTITSTYGLYIGDVTAGTQTNVGYSLFSQDANSLSYFAGRVGVGIDPATALLQLGANTTTRASLKLTLGGTLLTTPEPGAVEAINSHLYWTDSTGTRFQLDQQSGGGGGSVALNAITAATATNSINNVAYNQTWAWDSLTSGTGFTLSSSSITSGVLQAISTSNNTFNSTSGLLTVSNSGTNVSGTLAKFVANGTVTGAGMIIQTSGKVSVGKLLPDAQFHIGGTPDVSNNATAGMVLAVDSNAITDTTSAASSTTTHVAVSAFNAPSMYASNTAVTYTNASTLYIANAPTPVTNVTITNPYALFVEKGKVNFSDTTATTNAILRPMQVTSALTTGTVGNSFGTGILFRGTANNSGTPLMQDMTAVNSIWTNATNGSRNSAVTLHGVQSAGSLSEMVRFTAASAPTMTIASSMGTVGDTIYRNNGIIATSNYSLSSSGNLTLSTDGSASFLYLSLGDNAASSTSGIDLGNAQNQVQTSGTRNGLLMSVSFAPTSGTAVHNKMAFTGTINQTGGANGIWRGIYTNHTVTAVANGRLIELAESSANMKGIYQTGTLTTNNFVGKTAFGSTSTPTEMVNITGNMLVAGQYASTRFALTDGATIAVDWNNSNVQSVVLGGNRTFTFANPKDGARYLIKVKQDGTGSRTVTWPTIKWAGGTAPTLTTAAGKYDWVTLIYDSVDGYSGEISKNY